MDKLSKICGIYKITSPNGKIYIGQSIDIKRRNKSYESLYCKDQVKLYNSINKHGWNNHIKEILTECSINELDKWETHWKIYYLAQNNNDWSKMLFCGLHDKGGGPKTKETCKLISEAKKGQPVSESRKEKMRKPFTKEHKLSLRNGIIESRGKKVKQFDLNGNLIKEWQSASTAERKFNKKLNTNNISTCARKKQKTAYGFIWEYK